MIQSATAKSDLIPHAAAIDRWDNEGGASSRVPEREKIENGLKHRRSVSANLTSRRVPDAAHRACRRRNASRHNTTLYAGWSSTRRHLER